VVVAQIDGDFTIKTYESQAGRLRLVPANPAYSPLEPSEGCSLCGVATYVIHRL
jgi:SOS-response transcriptional repressor LexA